MSPVIISVSRATDIPAFYMKWFKKAWQNGQCYWKNSYTKEQILVNFDKVRCVVFWSKNYAPLIKEWKFITTLPNTIFHFTLNDYKHYETSVAELKFRIKTFKELSNLVGKDRVIWRFDPLILSKDINLVEILKRVKNLGDELSPYTTRFIFSFLDIYFYKKVSRNLAGFGLREFSADEMREFGLNLAKFNKEWNLDISSCCEEIDLSEFGIKNGKCIDEDDLVRNFSHDAKLMEYLGVKIENSLFGQKLIKTKSLKDSGQRKFCKCIKSKDIGFYNSCPHGCIYCYANLSQKSALENYKNLSFSF
ncbi:DUF1848 domain-containing protein [Campylobacter corcagiensis]|uniref:DUF1848 domain-containing protein n=1 Tax=Campylobacter corcagiensis TaxID=1448857 RepID=A0A7M1LG33_9BACT|nr:DUF1848 domain-containing protein [Campylobacter corcagiensis]QKF64424.1 DUF1848 domain-containing protein [Campylobacter corcagiensis]QOQ87390.1 DUF1848 domain-containing protein [Campylobacter corcagiensis]